MSHGVLGCHADGVDGWWSNLSGPGFRVISPSRFGYFGSTLPRNATPAAQADAYALLLDHLGAERAVVMGFSAGSASVLELARRHPDRVLGLILASARLGGGITVNKRLAPAFRLAYSAGRLFWIFKTLAPTPYTHMMGAPKGYRPTPAEAKALDGFRELLFPLKPRRDGAVLTVSSPTWSPTGSPSRNWPSPPWSSPHWTTRWPPTPSPPKPQRVSPGHGWSRSNEAATCSSATTPRSATRSPRSSPPSSPNNRDTRQPHRSASLRTTLQANPDPVPHLRTGRAWTVALLQAGPTP
jgi:alpha/beta hydrolase fold